MKLGKIIKKEVPATWLKRTLAYAIDFFLVNLLVTIPFKDTLKAKVEQPFFFSTATDKNLIAISLITSILLFLYFVILEKKIQQTLGKLLLGIKIKTKGKEIALTPILIRNISKPFPLILLVDTAYALFKGKQQRLLELFSKTEVIQEQIELK